LGYVQKEKMWEFINTNAEGKVRSEYFNEQPLVYTITVLADVPERYVVPVIE
jgi:hypothetical protein